MKVGMLATVNPQGLPHLTLISTLRGASPTQVVWGQFAEGQSKYNIQQNPKTGLFIMTLEKNIWRGKATYTHTAVTGKEYEIFNNTDPLPLQCLFWHPPRLVHGSGGANRQTSSADEPVIQSAVKTIVARKLSPGRGGKDALNPWIHKFIGKLDNLKFLTYVGADGYPVIIPVIQAQTAGNGQLVFSPGHLAMSYGGSPPGADGGIRHGVDHGRCFTAGGVPAAYSAGRIPVRRG